MDRVSTTSTDATIGTSLGQTVGAEDCLYVNIWRPATAATLLPVIVWVHGGSNISGYTADPMYDGANLARTANVVIVSVNYRLGVMGFFNLGQLKTGDAVTTPATLRCSTSSRRCSSSTATSRASAAIRATSR
jgi:carboxylesterase type B